MNRQHVRGRLAPSPTGAQHLGNARTYLLAWLHAKSQDGEVWLRIEDIDTGRNKPGAADLVMEDLQWLGLCWDHGPFFQSQRLELYRHALAELQRQELVYPCTCTRADIANASTAPHIGEEGPIYPGTCANRSVRDAQTLHLPFAWRARFRETTTVVDQFAGVHFWTPQQIGGDFVVWRNDDTPAYQLAVVVDDALMEISDVIRGDDLLSSTAKQLWLYQHLQYRSPNWLHVPLVLDHQGKRFAKRDGSVQLQQLRQQGITAEQVLGLLAWSCGWQAKPTPLTLSEVQARYRIDTLPKEPWVCTPGVLKELFPI